MVLPIGKAFYSSCQQCTGEPDRHGLDLVIVNNGFLDELDHRLSIIYRLCRIQGDFLGGRAEPDAVKSGGQAQAQPQQAEAKKGQVNIFSGESSAGTPYSSVI